MLGIKRVAILIICSFLLPVSSYADENSAPLNGKQEELLKLFLPSLFKTASTAASAPSGMLSGQQQKVAGILQSTLTGTMQDTTFKIALPHQIYYEVASDETHQILTITFADMGDGKVLPEFDTLNTAVERVTYNVGSENQFVITFLLAPNVDVKGLRMDGNHPAEFVLDVGLGPAFSVPVKMKEVKTSGPYQPLVKKPVPILPDELLEKNINEAVSFLSQQRAPDALKVLKTSVPKDIASHLSYYVVLAEAYRQSGNALEAEKIYQALIKQEPDNADWQVGLGMCYERLNQKDAAMTAYNKALALGNLSPSLQQYVAQALKRGT